MKKFRLLICLVAVLIIVGCAKAKTESDVEKYLEETIGIKDYTLGEKKEFKDEVNDYTDYYWEVKYKSIEFTITDYYYYSHEHTENKLITDYPEKVIEYHLNKYPNRYNIIFDNPVDVPNEDKSFICNINGESDNYSLRNCYDNIVNFLNTIDFKTYPMGKINVQVVNNNRHNRWLTIYDNKEIKSFQDFDKK